MFKRKRKYVRMQSLQVGDIVSGLASGPNERVEVTRIVLVWNPDGIATQKRITYRFRPTNAVIKIYGHRTFPMYDNRKLKFHGKG